VEVLAAIAIIGIITFLAIPNILRIKQDGEQSLAVSRAEALNMAMASYLQANGQASAVSVWSGAMDNDARYALLTSYVAFAPADLDDYMPTGYTISLPSSLSPLTKATLTGPSGAISY
jgi:type II secretory pathway pseudopilin PulG